MTEDLILDVEWASLGLTTAHVFEAWGAAHTPWAATVENVLGPLLETASAFAPFRAGWRAFPDVRVDRAASEV